MFSAIWRCYQEVHIDISNWLLCIAPGFTYNVKWCNLNESMYLNIDYL